MRENEMQGNISINDYQEIEKGYSVFDSTAEFLDQWAKDNAKDNAQIKSKTDIRLAKVCKVKACKNGNLFLGCYDEQMTGFVNFFVPPAIVLNITNKQVVQATYTTTPKGHTVQTGWQWVDNEVLQDAFKDLQVVYIGKDILEVF